MSDERQLLGGQYSVKKILWEIRNCITGTDYLTRNEDPTAEWRIWKTHMLQCPSCTRWWALYKRLANLP